MKLEELERRLRTDIMQEAIAWAGRVMLHKEVSLDTPAARELSFEQAATPSRRSPPRPPGPPSPHLLPCCSMIARDTSMFSFVVLEVLPEKVCYLLKY